MSSLVELRNGKVIFKQKCTSFEKQSETLQGSLHITPARLRAALAPQPQELIRNFRDCQVSRDAGAAYCKRSPTFDCHS
jgi:hypothetical protein